jgi:hypothetical protein
MVKRRSFGTVQQPLEPIEIEVNGEVFTVNQKIPGPTMLNFLAGADETRPDKMAASLQQFLQIAIEYEDRERWEKFIENPDNGVTLDILAEIAGYLVETLSGGGEATRPTPPSSPSTSPS